MEIRKLLVANRGEIAARIFSTCDRLGIATVAVAAPDDAGAFHTRRADEAEEVPSYLDIAGIVAAATRAGADAVHPGYGFLAENPGFAEAVVSAGLRFVGPSPEAIRAAGDKLEAKRLAAEAGVPVVQSGDPEEIGFPLMVKAAAGGGGRGMRLVRSPEELEEALESARREAASGFGDDRVFCERYVERPRHVEIQLLADAHGTTVHLGERDCSVQRRHQKILEESPSPAVGPDLRAEMGEAAVAFARAVGYESAGTAEFMLADGEFFFLELNARIQVEHPVTELVIGLDLVEEQLRIASGESLEIEARQPEGHAVEVTALRRGSAHLPPPHRHDHAAAASTGDPRRPGRRGGRRDPGRLRPADREADRPRGDAGGGARLRSPPRCARPRFAAWRRTSLSSAGSSPTPSCGRGRRRPLSSTRTRRSPRPRGVSPSMARLVAAQRPRARPARLRPPSRRTATATSSAGRAR